MENLSLRLMEDNIRENRNFSFIRCGDGEMLAMSGVEGQNCDGQKYGPKLAESLRKAFKYLGENPSVKISKWKLPGLESQIECFEKELGIKCTENHDLLMNRMYELTFANFSFWQAVKNSKRRKIFVGPERLIGVINFLNIDEMKVVPPSNAFDKEMIFEPCKDDIWLFSAGLAAKVWAAEVLKVCSEITVLDCGSSFDPIFFGQTRTKQVPTELIREFYKDLLN